MSEKTEKPTARRIAEARKKGQVAKSTEITSGAQLTVLLGYFLFEGVHLLHAFQMLVNVSIESVNDDFTAAITHWVRAFGAVLIRFTIGMAMLVIASTVVAVIAQIGPLFAIEALKPSFNKINPLSNFKQMFSLKGLFEFVKSLFKVGALSAIFFYLIRQYAPSLQFLSLFSIESGLAVSTQLLYWMWAALIAFYVVFGIADFAFQCYNTRKQLMMSPEDIKQEFKNSEGDPEIKHRRREIHREVHSGSLAANVAKSTVVVRNPTHVAVCVYYRRGETPLPEVVEIGHDKLALHIVALAERANVPVVENVLLARALAGRLQVGQRIPPDLFEAVAHVLRVAMELHYDHDIGEPDPDAGATELPPGPSVAG
ncbi:EscU/YscU/HrcU family type III secretion system export apparatus switch protein [Burkholderia sp. Nafp2/4-1b]|uniref:EscU/YscU/HrcU family type III secretion system export apparatus switch protein n=1 Tax=Burkholderia sp. Nafp2/4-1b TaxID=2116686 RepID=UPI000EF949C3|nr:EscU/YscU/HrcU family type III secretion system export apparatus switch protein [Burkholderia sp. Nafp2/4-1b]RKT98834.1 EscU/YscU/HrcU family type III secretion system export apparatus switch protein [Burkholderia sp. Nafp2/4-1b]